MICPNCGNHPTHTDYCEYCGQALSSDEQQKKKTVKRYPFPLLTILFCILLLLCAAVSALHHLSLGGYSSLSVAHIQYDDPEKLIHDYLTTAKTKSPRYILAFYHPEIIKHYSRSYRNNEDVLWAVDAAYRDGIYETYDFFLVDKTIEWTNEFYQGELEDHDIHADSGEDVRIVFQITDSPYAEHRYYYELVQQQEQWYLICVYQ